MKKAYLSGGTGSVGRAILERLTRDGLEVTFQYFSNEAEAAKLAAEYGARPLRLDLTQPLAESSLEYDVLVNNAGVNLTDRASHEVSVADWEKTLAVNLDGAFRLVRACLPHMIEKGWGRIVNVSSIYGLKCVEGNLPYNVSKHGLSGLTRTVALEYAAQGITSNEVCPAAIESELMRRIAERETDGSVRAVSAYLEEVARSIPLKRLISPSDVASAVGFLVSDDASAINGVSLRIDGGLLS